MKKQVRFSLEKGDLLPTLLMLPALIMIVFVMIVPLIYGLSLSFFEVGFGETNFKAVSYTHLTLPTILLV